MLSYLRKQDGNKYKRNKNMCLAGVMLVTLYAVITFPGYYENGPSLYDWTMIVLTLLSGIVLLYMERSFSSRECSRPHDLNTPGGSLNAFSFQNAVCAHCGGKLILAARDKVGRLSCVAPGSAAQESSEMLYYCPQCDKAVCASERKIKEFATSSISVSRFAALGLKIQGKKYYRINSQYIKTHFLTTMLTLVATLSSFYFARASAIRLILPATVGYLLFVCVYNLLYYISMRYYVLDIGVLQRSLWGYSLYAFEDTVAVVSYGDESGSEVWGLITNKENLLISVMIKDSVEMIRDVRQRSAEKSIVEIIRINGAVDS